jgi:heme-degrading monooxygenase HmoA
MSEPAKTPRPPYFAVIFTSTRTDIDEGYGEMADRMAELGSRQPGFLGLESVRGEDGLGVTISYWRSLEEIERWRNVAEHLTAQRLGREQWYRSFVLRVARVEDAWTFERDR